MGISLKVFIYLMTAGVNLLSVTGDKGRLVNIPCDQTPVTQTTHDGDSVTIDCNYPRAKESNIRYFCRGDENIRCTHLPSPDTHRKHTKKDYNVTISTLALGDGGIYRCAVKKFDNASTTCLTQIHTEILKWDDITPSPKKFPTGNTLKIDCPYPDSHETNEKFLCKGETPLYCEVLINTTQEHRTVDENRLSIRDNKRLKYFYVNIKNLNTTDSGTYWCGSDRTWQPAKYTKVLLSVDESHAKTKRSSTREDEQRPPQDVTGIIAGCVCLGLLLVLAVVLIMCRHNLPGIQACCAAGESSQWETNAGHNTEGNNGDHQYDEIQIQNQQANSGGALPSVYATVNLPADQLHYASVNFQKDSVCVSTDGTALPDTNKNGSSTCSYSSISHAQGATHPPAAEQTLYSTVTKPGEP